MLYVFATSPNNLKPGDLRLHSGGLTHLINVVEELGIVENHKSVQYRKEGAYTPGAKGEWLWDVDYRMSDICLSEGITWDWFPAEWTFGSGITCHKTSANPEYETVVHGTDLQLDDFLREYGSTKLADLELERRHIQHEGWLEYEARWLPGTCPQYEHQVFLTWVMTVDPLPEFAYERLRSVVEDGVALKDTHLYNHDQGAMFSTIRKWDGKPAYGGSYAVPQHS
jgi:hypothetical protein